MTGRVSHIQALYHYRELDDDYASSAFAFYSMQNVKDESCIKINKVRAGKAVWLGLLLHNSIKKLLFADESSVE
jgi:hypothetical protein